MKVIKGKGLDVQEYNEKQNVAQAIIDMLAQHEIQLRLEDIIIGATVTRYVFSVLSPKTRMSEFRKYADAIADCAQSSQNVMIHAPLDDTGKIGVDIANSKRRTVELSELLEKPEFNNAKGELVFVLGEDVSGKVVVADLTKLPHLLVAGTTGSGKTVFLNELIVSLIYKYGPNHVRFLMVDPKFIELANYDGLPHMLTPNTVTNPIDVFAGMDYLISEMEARYNLFRANDVISIVDYNKYAQANSLPKLPYLVFIVDELSDIMAVNKVQFETRFVKLAQKSRAAGIHIVLTTMRFDIQVISGSIRANMPSRIAFRASSDYDSQVILGGSGAEKLLGFGDMLFTDVSQMRPNRVQAAYISTDDVRSFVERSKQLDEANYDKAIADRIFVSLKPADESDTNDADAPKDELYPYYKKVLRFWLERNNGKASIASIQRAFGIGFNRSGRILENLQSMGYVDTPLAEAYPSPLKVRVTLEELDVLFPDTDDD